MSFSDVMDYLRDVNIVSVILRFALAVLFGGVIGATRGRGQHAAGLRTHMLVCLGAACVVVVNQYCAFNLGWGGDALRMPAQVVSGIGFLGAGSIIVTGRSHVTGLTTAAGLWASACMGIACGAGFYECAVLMFLFIYIALVILYKLDHTRVKTFRSVNVLIEFADDTPMSTLLRGLDEIGLKMREIERFGHDGSANCCYRTELDVIHSDGDCADEIAEIRKIPGVIFAEELG